MNIFVLDRNYNKIGVLSNQGANPTAPYFDDLYVQELDTGADTFTFSTLSTYYTQDIIEIGHHVIFEYNNEHKLFAISSIEFSHKDGFNLIEVYAEGVGFNLLDNYIESLEGSYNYESFLAEVLAGTDWRYVVSGSLANNVQEISYTSEKNIYAVLQDSMQTFLGAELKFVAEYRNGSLTKTIYAYGNGERGSFVGKRFEYGVNVKGITKTLNIANEKDENVIFNEGLVIIDGVEVEISYDVDFALRSFEVEELDIGDTHYVIDNDFDPPLQIKARIGKIEISFSDPTKNKCYLANFKKVTGSKPEDPDGQDVEDMIDDKLEDIGDGLDDRFNDIEERLDKLENPEEDPEEGGGEVGEHKHTHLTAFDDNYDYLMFYGYSGTSDGSGYKYHNQHLEFKDSTTTFDSSVTFQIFNTYSKTDWLNLYVHRDCDKFYDNGTTIGSDDLSYRIAHIFSDVNDLIPQTNSQLLGNAQYSWKEGYINNLFSTAMETRSIKFADGTTMTTAVNLDGYATESYVDTAVAGMSIDLTDYATKTYVDGAIAEIEIPDLSGYATEDYVDNAIEAIEIPDVSVYATKKSLSDFYSYVNLIYATHDQMNGAIETSETDMKAYVDEAIEGIESGSGGLPSDVFEVKNGNLHIKLPINFEDSANFVNCTIGESPSKASLTGAEGIEAMTIYCANINPVHDGSGIVRIDGDLEVTGNITSASSSNSTKFDAIYVNYIWSNNVSGTINFQDDLVLHNSFSVFGDIDTDGNINAAGDIYCNSLTQYSDKSLKENIRYIDDSVMTMSSDDLLEKADLYDFIVNQIDLCEFNFIGDDSDKIGFIANDYEGTKVGDKIVSKYGETLTYDVSNLLFATIGALQEEVRIRDEKIASLEDRLAKIEAMLGIDNN